MQLYPEVSIHRNAASKKNYHNRIFSERRTISQNAIMAHELATISGVVVYAF